MKALTSFVVAAALFGSGCAKGQGPATGGNKGPDPATSRAVSIYEAVIRRLVTTEDSTFGPNPKFPVIYLLDQAREGAANPESSGGEGAPLPAEVKAELLSALSDLPVEFVSDDGAVIIPIEEGGGVKDEGVVVAVGPIPDGDEQVEVEASLYAGNLAATWLTYVVKRSSQGWRVTGTTGPVAIS
jgi:hypothetical protein